MRVDPDANQDGRLRDPYKPEMGIGTFYWPSRPHSHIAAQVGSDVPLFLIGGAILGLDRGQEVYPFPDLESLWCVIATPTFGVSTPQAFRDWDALCANEGLTAEASDDRLERVEPRLCQRLRRRNPARSAWIWLLRCPFYRRGPRRTSRVRACPHRDQ